MTTSNSLAGFPPRTQLIADPVAVVIGDFFPPKSLRRAGLKLALQWNCSRRYRAGIWRSARARGSSMSPGLLLLALPFDAADRVLGLRRRGVRAPDRLCALP